MIGILLAPLPAVITVLLIAAAIIPWGGPPWAEMAVILLPLGGIYFWSVRRPHLMPAVLVFALGLVLDVLTHGPFGIWAGAALLVALLGRYARRARPQPGWTARTLHFVVTMALATAMVAALESGFAWRPMPIFIYAQALVAASLAYPVLAFVLSLLEPLWPAGEGRALFMRGD